MIYCSKAINVTAADTVICMFFILCLCPFLLIFFLFLFVCVRVSVSINLDRTVYLLRESFSMSEGCDWRQIMWVLHVPPRADTVPLILHSLKQAQTILLISELITVRGYYWLAKMMGVFLALICRKSHRQEITHTNSQEIRGSLAEYVPSNVF